VSVSVSYKNGTAVSDAYVSANVVGANWYWGDSSKVTMYAQTAANGIAHLVVPNVPLAVSASKSVQVTLPKSQTTTQVTIGGQVVNVTVYYSPSYVYESAAALLIPPQASLGMVLAAQTGYPIFPYGAGASASGAPTSVGGAPNSVQAQTASQGAPGNGALTAAAPPASIPPFLASDVGAHAATTAETTPTAPGVNLLAIGTLALAGAIAAVVGVAISRARR
jgi:hypothetical protein